MILEEMAELKEIEGGDLTLKAPRKKIHLKMPSAEVVCCQFLLTLFNKAKYRQTVWTQIRLLLYEQSDLSLNCLLERLLKHLSRRQKRTNFVVIGTLRV